MKKSIAVILALLVVCIGVYVPAAAKDTNILQSGDMEAFDTTIQDCHPFYFWSDDSSMSFGQGLGAEIVSNVAHSGKKSIFINMKTPGKQGVFFQFGEFGDGGTMTKDQTYVLTAWVKADLTSVAEGVYLTTQYKVGGHSASVLTEQPQTSGGFKKAGSYGWTKLQYSFKPSSASGWSNSVSCASLCVCIQAVGKVWIDDVSLTKAGDPVPDYVTMDGGSTSVGTASNKPSTTKSSGAATGNGTGTNNATGSSQTTVSTSEVSSAESTQSLTESLTASSLPDSLVADSTSSSANASSANAKKNGSAVAFIIIGAVILIAGGITAAYFLIFKKKIFK